MNIVIGLSDDDIFALTDIKDTINLLYDLDDFSDEMTEEECEIFDKWTDMSYVINKIFHVIENQIEIEETAARKTPVDACQECSMLSKQLSEDEIRCVRKMMEELDAMKQKRTSTHPSDALDAATLHSEMQKRAAEKDRERINLLRKLQDILSQ